MNAVAESQPSFVIGQFRAGQLPESVLAKARAQIGRALEHVGGADVDDMLGGVLMLVYEADDLDTLVATLAVGLEQWREENGQGRTALTVFAVGGESFWEWSGTVQRALEDMAREHGADSIRAIARPGMGKWLQRLGYGELAHVMEWRG